MKELRDTRRVTRDSIGFLRVSRLASRVSIIFLLVVVVGCVAPLRKVESPTRDPATLTEWQASGRIAVSGASGGGSGSFTWSQGGADAHILIRGPIGIGNLRLRLIDRRMSIETSDGKHYLAEEADTELAERLGARVPAADLRYWLVGVAAPGENERSDNGDTATLLQHDWRVDYQHFSVTGGVRLPMKLVAASGPAKVRIVIDRWTVK